MAKIIIIIIIILVLTLCFGCTSNAIRKEKSTEERLIEMRQELYENQEKYYEVLEEILTEVGGKVQEIKKKTGELGTQLNPIHRRKK